jgi:hypothetical protein
MVVFILQLGCEVSLVAASLSLTMDSVLRSSSNKWLPATVSRHVVTRVNVGVTMQLTQHVDEDSSVHDAEDCGKMNDSADDHVLESRKREKR